MGRVGGPIFLAIASAGSGEDVITTGLAALDFGPFPGKTDATVAVIGQSGIASASVVDCWLTPVASADHSADEHMLEELEVFAGDIVAGTGFTIYGIATGPTRVHGLWTVAWAWT